MSTRSALIWLAIGALFGTGVIGILSIGVLFIAFGVVLAVVAAPRVGPSGAWAGLVGFGGLPALILLWGLLSVPWACAPAGGGRVYEGIDYYSCVNTFVGPLTTYHIMAIGFAIIALLGLAWPFVHRLVARPARTAA